MRFLMLMTLCTLGLLALAHPAAAQGDAGAIEAAGCTVTYTLETTSNVIAYPFNILSQGPFRATDILVVSQYGDTVTYVVCIL